MPTPLPRPTTSSNCRRAAALLRSGAFLLKRTMKRSYVLPSCNALAFNLPAKTGAAKASDRLTANAQANRRANEIFTHRFGRLDMVIPLKPGCRPCSEWSRPATFLVTQARPAIGHPLARYFIHFCHLGNAGSPSLKPAADRRSHEEAT